MKIKILFAVVLSPGLLACTEQSASPSKQSAAVEGRGADTAKWWESLPRAEWSAYERVAQDIDWFEIYQVFPNVYAIYEPGQFEEVISFLIIGDDKALLFDTGLGIAKLQPVIARLTDHEIIVLNSHGHYDHIGGNHEFADIAGVEVPYAINRTKGASNDKVAEYVSGDWLWKETPADFDAATYDIKPYELTNFVKDGDIIDLGGRRLEVLLTPGHSPDSICLLDREERQLFTGDTFYLAPLYAHLEGSDFDQYKTTMERLAALTPEIDHLMTSHNVPVADAAYLGKAASAFEAISTKSAAYQKTDGAYEYQFDGFSVIAPKPGD